MENVMPLLENPATETDDHSIEGNFTKAFRDSFNIISSATSNSYHFKVTARKKLKVSLRRNAIKSSKGGYKKIGVEENQVKPRRKCSKFRLYLKKKKWAFRLSRIRISPIVLLRKLRDCYMRFMIKLYADEGHPAIVFNPRLMVGQGAMHLCMFFPII
eukprot:Gb_36506 [translate_table: standard]